MDEPKTKTGKGVAALNARQRRFVAEYLVDLNATQAAIRAGYSAKTASSQGYDLLRKPEIAAAIAEAEAERARRVQLRADEVLLELRGMVRSDVGALFDEKMQLRPLHEVPEEARRAIAAVEVEEIWGLQADKDGQLERVQTGRVCKVKFWSKPDATSLAMKHLGLLKDVVQHEGNVSIAVVNPYAEKPEGSDGA